MLKAGFTKELIYFIRTKKLMVITIVVLAFAVLDPLLMWGMMALMNNMADIATDATISSGAVDIAITDSATVGFIGSLGDITSTVSLIVMLVLMQTAGGELKKRATIIPNCAGLSPKAYLIPKFILYPIYMMVITFVGLVAAYGMSHLLFAEGFSFVNALVSAFSAGVYALFLNALYLCIGLSTSKAGAATAICFGGATILSAVLSALGAQKFHPFALMSVAQNAVFGEIDLLNLFGSFGVTVLIVAAFYLITVLALSAKRVDNIGGDIGEL